VTQFEGRASEMADLLRAIRGADGGIVTVCGLSGAGKSALVHAVAGLGTEHLLVLDDAGGGLDAVRAAAETDASGRRVVACSVLPLGVPGERVLHLRGLSASAAVTLFERVARESAVGWEAADPDRLGDLCRELGGWPLALITAAARSGGRTDQDAASLLDVPAPPALRGAGPRHGSCRSALEWTYRQLDEDTQRVLRTLAVFSGSFTPETALAASGLEASVGREALEVLTGLGIVLPRGPGEAYDVPEIFREYARRQLSRSGQEGRAWHRYTAHLVDLARQVAAALDDARDTDVPPAARLLQEDMLIALERLVAAGHDQQGLSLAADLVRMHTAWLGPLARLVRCLETLLERTDRTPSAMTASALVGSSELAYVSLDAVDAVDLAVRRCEEGVAMARALDDPLLLLRVLGEVIVLLPLTGDFERVRAAADEGRALATEVRHYRWLARFEAWTGMIEHQSGNVAAALEWGLAAQARARRSGDLRAQVLADLLLNGLPDELEVPGGRPTWRDLELLSVKLGDRRFEAITLIGQAGDAAREGRLEEAARLGARRIEIGSRAESWTFTGLSMMGLTMVAAPRGDIEQALVLHGCVLHRTTLLQSGVPRHRAREYNARLERLRELVGQTAFDDAVRRGAQMPWAEAERYALDYARSVAAGADEPVADQPFADSVPLVEALTARERQVLDLIAEGLSNRAIAERLGVTTKSAMHHASTVYRKLGVHGRAEAVAWAVRHGVGTG
jgi:DNA-binding CsgD family transcriptional regulator/predicted ATPase